MAIVVRGHERGALGGEGLFVALTRLCDLLPRASLFVRTWSSSDAPPGSTWRGLGSGGSARGRVLSRARVCGYFERGTLRERLASCELDAEPRGHGVSAWASERVWKTPVIGQQRMWEQQWRALSLPDTSFAAAISLRIDLFTSSFTSANGFRSDAALGWAPSAVANGIGRNMALLRGSSHCVHALGGCSRAIGADNVLLGTLGAMRTLAASMLALWRTSPAANISRAFHRIKPHHEAIVPMEIARLGLCCAELDALVSLRGVSAGEARPSFADAAPNRSAPGVLVAQRAHHRELRRHPHPHRRVVDARRPPAKALLLPRGPKMHSRVIGARRNISHRRRS